MSGTDKIIVDAKSGMASSRSCRSGR